MSTLKLAFTSEREVTIDEIVSEGDAMYKYVKTRFGKISAQALNAEIARDHPQFTKSYPLVTRYMCDMKQYSTRALKLWLIHIKENPWKTEASYIEAQADYVYKLVCAKNPRASETEKRAVKSNLRKLLMAEHEEFKECATGSEKAVTEREEMLRDRNVDELAAFLSKFDAKDLLSIGTVRIETDLEMAPRRSIHEISNMATTADTTVDTASSLFGL